MNEINGTVTKKEISKGDSGKGPWTRAAFEIAGNKYSTFNEEIINATNPGDEVNGTYEQSGKFKNIVTLNTTGKQQGFTEASNYEAPESTFVGTQTKIVRQNVLSTATKMLRTMNEIDPERAKEALKETEMFELVTNVAGELEKWINREE